MSLKKKILSAVFAATWFTMFLIVGTAEEGGIGYHAAFWLNILNFAVMGFSGFGSGLLSAPDDVNALSDDEGWDEP